MALTHEQGRELAALRELAYGPAGEREMTDAERDRLAVLEALAREGAPADAAVDDEDDTAENSVGDEAVSDGDPDAPVPTFRRRSPWRLVAAVLLALLVGAGAGWGVAATKGAVDAAASPGASGDTSVLPEFAYAQTEEDLVPDGLDLDALAIPADSTRFVGTVEGVDVFLAMTEGDATGDGQTGVCLLIVPAAVNTATAGCAGLSADAEAVPLRVSGLAAPGEFTIGEQDVAADALHLSQSVSVVVSG